MEENATNIYVVVKASRGLVAIAEAFLKESSAEKRYDELMSDINPEYDDVDIFYSSLIKS